MAEQVNTPNTISMALDMKRNRIRIHKPAIHMLGDPTLIQLLFDPEDMEVAIVCPESEVPADRKYELTLADSKAETALNSAAACSLKSSALCMEIWMRSAPTG